MAVPVGFIRNKNPNLNLRGALKVNAIFATDNAIGTEPFQGWLADNNVVTSFNDALIENNIGVVDTDGFNITQSNRFAFTSMSEGQKVVRQNMILVKFADPIDPTNGTFSKGDLLEFVSNDQPFGTLAQPSNGKQYRIYGVVREKNILIEGISSITNNGNGTWTVVLNTDSREDLQAYTPSTSTGNNINEGDSVVIFGNRLTSAGLATSLNGTYVITSITSTSITYVTNSNPIGGDTFQSPGKFYKITNELLLIETLRGRATNVSYNNGSNVLNLSDAAGVIRSGTFVPGQLVTSSAVTSIPTGTRVVSYSLVTNQIVLSQPVTQTIGGATITFELDDPQNDVVIPFGSIAAAGSAQCFINAGIVIDSSAIKTPINYYVYGDVRLKYFWASYSQDGIFDGWEQNFTPDGVRTLYTGGTLSSGTTLQLIGSDPVFDTEDTFNNVIKTLGISRGAGLGGDYTPSGRSALLYISATDSQGNTGGGGGRNRGTSTPAYTAREAIDTIKNSQGYWIGVIGGSIVNNCQNEIQTFRRDSTDGILGDPRGFVPIKGEVVTARIGVPVQSIQYENPADPPGTVRFTTYYDHKLGDPLDTLRIRVKNCSAEPTLDGLRDVTIVNSKNFYFNFSTNVGTLTNTLNYDDCGYILNVSSLLTIPTGFYRKSTFEYVNPTSLNDSRGFIEDVSPSPFALAYQPGVVSPSGNNNGLDRKEILLTLQVTETSGTLQYFSAYPIGDFFDGLPETNALGTPYFAYPLNGQRDVKFRVNTINVGQTEYIEMRDAEDITGSDLLDSGNTIFAEVTPKEEIEIILYPIEFTADVVSSSGTTATINNISIFEGPGNKEARDFTSISLPAGSGYLDALSQDTFTASNVATTSTNGTGLTFDIEVFNGEIVGVILKSRGTGYLPGDTGTINAITGGSVTTPAQFTIKNIDDYVGTTWTIEVIDPDNTNPGDNFYQQGNNWENPNSLPSKTQVQVSNITDNGNGTYDLILSKSILTNINDTTIAFCYPKDNRKVNVFVKPSNNFKDISVTAEAIAAEPSLAESDAYVTFGGYGYTKGDILTPSELTNQPATIVNAVFDRVTEILQDGFVWAGTSIIGTQTFQIVNLSGSLQGTGAAFQISQTITGLYNVVLTDVGSDFQVSERIVVPGYDLGGSTVATFVRTGNNGLQNGSGYPTSGTFTNVNTQVTSGTGNGQLRLNFLTNSLGQIINDTIQVNAGGSGYRIGDTGNIIATSSNQGNLSAGITQLATYEIINTENDLRIQIKNVLNNSNVVVTTASPHGFVPPLGRSTIDIVIQGVQASKTESDVGDFNGRKVAQVADSVTLIYDQSESPGSYLNSGTIFNVSPNVVNDSFASFANELFLNVNTNTNNPIYPYIRFVSSAVYDTTLSRVVVTTTEPHGLLSGQEIAVSGLVSSRGADWNIGKGVVSLTTNPFLTNPVTQFAYSKTIGQPGIHITGTGEVTNPYVKVLGGIFTKDFYRIIFVNTNNSTQDGIAADKTKDFLVRDINFKQISNDGLEVRDGEKHNFYITSSNELVVINKVSQINSIVVIPESLEYEVTTSSPHGMYEGNLFNLQITNAGVTNQDDYETPGGSAPPDEVSTLVSDTKFRYKIYRTGRASGVQIVGDPIDATGFTATPFGTVTKIIGVGTGTGDIFVGPTGNPQTAKDIVKLSGLSGFPGVQSNSEYYLVTADPDGGGTTDYITLQLSDTRSGSPLTWSLSIVNASYNRSTEKAVIEVSGLTPHNLEVGNIIDIGSVTSDDYNGIQTITDIISPTIFTYSIPPLAGITDVTNQSISKNIASGGTAPATTTKICNSVINTDILTIRGGGGRARASEGIVPGMLVTGPGIVTNPPTYVDSFNASTRQINLTQPVTSTQGGGGATFTFATGIAGSYAIALANTGTYPQLQQIAPGQIITGTGITGTVKVLNTYISSQDDPTQVPAYAYITIDTPLINTLNAANNPYTFRDNLQNGKSIRITNITPVGSVPQVGAEIVSVGGTAGNVFPTGTLITAVNPYTIGPTSGYIITLDSNLLINLTNQTIAIYPDTNAGGGGTVSPVFAEFDPNNTTEILNEDTTFSGQLQLTADIRGWDHVALAKETGGALFFQLGYARICNGVYNSLNITATQSLADLISLFNTVGANTIGVYGEGIAPGATIVSISGSTITLDKPNIQTFTGDYVGFARQNSVSVFPKYTQEFGRILGKTFAEWLFKIA